MSINLIINDFTLRKKQELRALSDFSFHTEAFWSFFLRADNLGSSPLVRNPHTGTITSEAALVNLIDQYRANYILPFSFQHLLTIFETYLFGVLKSILVNNPVQLSQERQFRVRDVVEVHDRQALLELFAERELLDLAYKKPRDWFEYLQKLIRISVPTKIEIESFTEMKACRDVLIHNTALVNQIYLDKAGANARWQVGERVLIDPPYFHSCWNLLDKMLDDISRELLTKLSN